MSECDSLKLQKDALYEKIMKATARLKETVTITINPSVNNFGDIIPNSELFTDPSMGVYIKDKNQPFTITAVPPKGWKFKDWTMENGTKVIDNPLIIKK